MNTLKLEKSNITRYFLILVSVAHFFLAAFAAFENNWLFSLSYAFYTCTFIVLLLVGFSSKNILPIKFFVLFVYLGFFVKFCNHLIFVYPFGEPIGAFIGEPEQLKTLFNTASVGALGIIAALGIINRFFYKKNDQDKFTTFNRFKKSIALLRLLFVILLLSVLMLAYLNIKLGIDISGLAAVTVFIWPTNAIIGFLLGLGFSVLIYLFAEYEFFITERLRYSLILIFIEATFVSISILSRGLFLFHFLPFFMCLYVYRKKLRVSLFKLSLILASGFVLYFGTGIFVTNAREKLYYRYQLDNSAYSISSFFSFKSPAHIDDNSDDETLNQVEYKTKKEIIFGKSYLYKPKVVVYCENQLCNKIFSYVRQISTLAIDRWIGVEGLMAVVSYEHKDISLIYKSLFRFPRVGEKDIFEIMNGSFYPVSKKYVFTSLPGPIAFFYYSASNLVVFLGMILFVVLLYLLQLGVCYLTKSIFVQYLTGFIFAINFMQFGISPRPLVVTLIMLFAQLLVLNIFLRFKKFKV